jgi:hypothetical protein
MSRSNTIRSIVTLGLLLLTSTLADAQWTGGYAAAFLNRSAFAQEVARAGTFTPFAPDASAIFSNAATLALLDRPSATFAASSAPLSQRSAALGIGMRIAQSGGIGVGVQHYGIGTIIQRDEAGRNIGTTGDQWLGVSLGGALKIGPGSLGATIRYIREDIGGVENGASGYAMDLSGAITFSQQFFFALGINNIAGEMVPSYTSGRHEQIPLDVRLGAAYLYSLEDRVVAARPDPTGIERKSQLRPSRYVLALAEARMLEVESDVRLSAAIETVPVDFVDLGIRLGVNSAGDLTFGFLYRLPVDFTDELRIDYAIRRDYEYDNTQLTHHVTLTAGF